MCVLCAYYIKHHRCYTAPKLHKYRVRPHLIQSLRRYLFLLMLVAVMCRPASVFLLLIFERTPVILPECRATEPSRFHRPVICLTSSLAVALLSLIVASKPRVAGINAMNVNAAHCCGGFCRLEFLESMDQQVRRGISVRTLPLPRMQMLLAHLQLIIEMPLSIYLETCLCVFGVT